MRATREPTNIIIHIMRLYIALLLMRHISLFHIRTSTRIERKLMMNSVFTNCSNSTQQNF